MKLDVQIVSPVILSIYSLRLTSGIQSKPLSDVQVNVTTLKMD